MPLSARPTMPRAGRFAACGIPPRSGATATDLFCRKVVGWEDNDVGAWGVGIFSNDVASDIREDFRDLVADGLSATAATDQLVSECGVGKSNDDDNDFWLGLAVTQPPLGSRCARGH